MEEQLFDQLEALVLKNDEYVNNKALQLVENPKGYEYIDKAFGISKVVNIFLQERKKFAEVKQPEPPKAQPIAQVGEQKDEDMRSSLQNPDDGAAAHKEDSDVAMIPDEKEEQKPLGPMSLYQVVLMQPESQFYMRSLVELNNEFNFLWQEEEQWINK